MREFKFLFAFLLLCSAAACQKSDVAPEERKPFAFAASEETKSGLADISDNFRVWATIVQGSSSSTEMPGYLVEKDNALEWRYKNIDGQELKYWISSADAYHFHAGAPDYVTNDSGKQVAGIFRNAGTPATPAITENSLTLKMIATKDIQETSLYSQPYLVKRTDPSFGSLVNLKFCYAHAKVNVAFKYINIINKVKTVTIKNIKLTPPGSIATEATLQLNYDWARPAVSAGTLDIIAREVYGTRPLMFEDIAGISPNSKDYHTSTPWYVIPDPASKGDWTIIITVASEGVPGKTKKVTFTVDTPWESGKAYLYRFVIFDIFDING